MSEDRTRTLDSRTRASDPGRLQLSPARLKRFRPDLFGVSGACRGLLERVGLAFPERLHFEEHLRCGDSRAAVVMSTQPLLVAAYTDELDCVAMLRFRLPLAGELGLVPGDRLLTVNLYRDGDEIDEDLFPGPGSIGRWSGFSPLIADFLTEETGRVAARKEEIAEREWERAARAGRAYLQGFPGVARDGRPGCSELPARVPPSLRG